MPSERGQRSNAIRAGMIVLFLTILVSPGNSASLQNVQTGLIKTIISLDKTRTTVLEQHTYAADRTEPAYSREEALLFVAYLEGRISHYCKALYLNGGPQSLKGLPCGNEDQGLVADPRFESVPDFSGQTSKEKVASLEKEFTASLGEFDDMLLEEQEKVAAHTPRQREGGAAGQGGQTGENENLDGSAGTDAETGEQTNGDKAGESDSRQAGGGPERSASSEGAGQGRTGSSKMEPTEGSREMSDDDDVVARQLREAAEQETDPEVKEKLWEEYRKYKEGTR